MNEITLKMEITILGSGTSQGVPMIGCKCSVCLSTNPKDRRLRSSILIKTNCGKQIVIDSGPDFRFQMLREKVDSLDAIILTHDHKDHIGGLDDVRAYNYLLSRPMDVYGEDYVLKTIRKDFGYAFKEHKYPGVPEIILHTISTLPFMIGQTKIIPIRGIHYQLPVLGFRIDNFCYITDMNYIHEEEIDKIRGVDVLIINALRLEKHISHFTLNEALEVIAAINPKQAYLTHMSHQIGLYDVLSKTLPENVFLSYDTQKITL